MNNKMNELIDIELKPCPFCAGEAVLFERFRPTWVMCKNAGQQRKQNMMLMMR